MPSVNRCPVFSSDRYTDIGAWQQLTLADISFDEAVLLVAGSKLSFKLGASSFSVLANGTCLTYLKTVMITLQMT